MPVGSVNTIGVRQEGSSITTVTHPHYKKFFQDWIKWRLTFEGGEAFIFKYLVHFSHREDNKEFAQRRGTTYNPAFAKSAIYEIRNSIFTRTGDISREGGSEAYQQAVKGKDNGVDLNGADMNYFMCIKILQELIVMSRVGIYVDMPANIGLTLADKGSKRPYVYMYQAEDIRSWTYDIYQNPSEFSSLLLVDHNFDYDEETGLPCDEVTRYRFLYIKTDDYGKRTVWCKYYSEEGFQIDEYGNETIDMVGYETQIGNLEKIPFHMLDIGNSLLADAANYQVALLNMASSDVSYVTRGNFPFYIEPYDPRSASPYVKQTSEETFDSSDPISGTVTTTSAPEVIVGPTRGRRYPIGTSQPAFINPSPEPLIASMAKQDQLKAEIRQLVNLALSSISSSADSKSVDKEGLQNGLSYISKILEYAENRVAYFWSLYEGKPNTLAEIKYPVQYQLVSPDQVDKEVENLLKVASNTTSQTLRRRIMKVVAELRIGSYVKQAELDKIHKEIDNADVVIANAADITIDIQAGLVSLETASKARGYPQGEVEKAAKDHAERIKRIQDAQTPPDNSQARGLSDLSTDPNAGKTEKSNQKDQTANPNPEDPTRGPGTNNNS